MHSPVFSQNYFDANIWQCGQCVGGITVDEHLDKCLPNVSENTLKNVYAWHITCAAKFEI